MKLTTYIYNKCKKRLPLETKHTLRIENAINPSRDISLSNATILTNGTTDPASV